MSSTLGRLGRNLRWLLVSESTARILGLVYTALAARLLGLERFGLLALALVFSEAFQLLAGLSFPEVLIRRAAAAPGRTGTVLGAMLRIQTAALVPAVLLGGVLGSIYGGVLAVLLPLSAGLGWLRALARTHLAVTAATEDFRPTAIHAVGERLGALAALGGFLLAGRDFVLFFVFLTAASGLTLLYAAGTSRGGLRRLAREAGDGTSRAETETDASPRALLGEGLSFSAVRWIGVLHNRLDTVLIQALAGSGALGLYAAAYRLMEAFKILPNLAERTLFPILSRAVGDRVRLGRLTARSIKALVGIAAPLALLAWVLGPAVVPLIYGADYAAAAPVWAILMGALVLICAVRPHLQLMRALRRLHGVNLATAAAAALNLGLNLVLIPRHGILGAALATVASEAFLLAAEWGLVRPCIEGASLNRLPALLPALVAMTGTVFWLGDASPWVIAPVSAVLYLGILIATRGLDIEDRRALGALVGRGAASPAPGGRKP